MPVSGSPKLFAAYHVLHRLSLPRHPPYALSSLTIKKLYKSINFYSCALMSLGQSCFLQIIYYYAIVKELFRKKPLRTPYKSLVEANGFEPMTPCVQGRCSPS